MSNGNETDNNDRNNNVKKSMEKTAEFQQDMMRQF